MVKVRADSSEFSEEFAYYLDYLENRYTELEEAARNLNQLADEDRIDLLLEWPLVRDRLSTLQRLSAESGVPTAYQRRYHELLSRIVKDQPLLNLLQS